MVAESPIADGSRAAICTDVNNLRLIYRTDGDGTGQLTATVQSDDFRGEGSGWFSVSKLREFYSRLGDFPINPSNQPSLTAGFYNSQTGQLDQCHVGITLSPDGNRGKIRVGVTLATEVWNERDHDHRHELTTWFLVSYNDLSVFRTAFAAMLKSTTGEEVEAVLEASRD